MAEGPSRPPPVRPEGQRSDRTHTRGVFLTSSSSSPFGGQNDGMPQGRVSAETGGWRLFKLDIGGGSFPGLSDEAGRATFPLLLVGNQECRIGGLFVFRPAW